VLHFVPRATPRDPARRLASLGRLLLSWALPRLSSSREVLIMSLHPYSAPTRARRRGLAVALTVFASACSTTATPLGESASFDDGASDEEDGTGGATESDDRGDDDDGVGTTGGGDSDDDDGTSDGAPEPEPGLYPECPRPLPPHWLFCADFEDENALTETFFEYQDADGAFVPVEGDAASGLRSMEATYREGVEGAGWLSVAFGRNPIVVGAAPHYAPDSDFNSIFWRFRVRMEPGWPDIGPHHLSRVSAFAAEDWLQAMAARLRSDGDGVVLVADPASCVSDDAVACGAYEDVDVEKPLGELAGSYPLFSSAASGEWHCVEAHVQLNEVGVPNGVLRFWVDGQLQNENFALDWRGSWEGYGLNLVTVDNRWIGGAPKELRRRIDDLVIATDQIGCD
jgi:hypothetical protein